MSLNGFAAGFKKSKVNGNHNESEGSISFKSGTKAAVNPTTIPGPDYGMGNAGGASGDGPTPGFTGTGRGVAELNGAQGN